jgi:ATP-dependent Zn protease
VRDLFKRARVNAPCIIFVDEIDALGGKRAPAVFRGNEEREQTLNQLLTEMDGFSSDTGVIFVGTSSGNGGCTPRLFPSSYEPPMSMIAGATNRADLLDPALTRPGRFDRKVTVRKPGANARQKILQIHASKTRVSDNVDLFQLANDLPGTNEQILVIKDFESSLWNTKLLFALRRLQWCRPL